MVVVFIVFVAFVGLPFIAVQTVDYQVPTALWAKFSLWLSFALAGVIHTSCDICARRVIYCHSWLIALSSELT